MGYYLELSFQIQKLVKNPKLSLEFPDVDVNIIS
jgi:hypothetical protein